MLAVGRSIADVAATGLSQIFEPVAQCLNNLAGFINGIGRLHGKCGGLGSGQWKAVDFSDAVHDISRSTSEVAERAVNFWMALMPDKNDAAAVTGVALDLAVDLGNKWANGVEGDQAAARSVISDLR